MAQGISSTLREVWNGGESLAHSQKPPEKLEVSDSIPFAGILIL